MNCQEVLLVVEQQQLGRRISSEPVMEVNCVAVLEQQDLEPSTLMKAGGWSPA